MAVVRCLVRTRAGGRAEERPLLHSASVISGIVAGEAQVIWVTFAHVDIATDYIKALRARTAIQQAWREMFEQIDVLVAPTLTTVALPVDDAVVRWPDGSTESATETYVRFSAPADVTGLPSLTVPCGFSSEHLPIGMQIMGKPFAEATVLTVGQAYESATDWTSRRALLCPLAVRAFPPHSLTGSARVDDTASGPPARRSCRAGGPLPPECGVTTGRA